jgi:outer membrane protein assembly factor BamB
MELNWKSWLIAFVVVFFVNSTLGFANWPDWRGPTGDGRSDATGLPLNWSESENIVWKTRIHDLGYSTPVVWGDQVWLTTATKDGRTLYAVCIDLNTGRVVHDVKVFQPSQPQRIHRYNSYATPSAVLEKDHLNCEHMQGPVSSPVLFEDLLIVHLEGTDVQFVVALDTKTGNTVWRYERPQELYGHVEPVYLRKAYHTPVLVKVNGRTQLVSNGAMLVTGHEPKTGKEIWRVRYRDDNTISRIVSGHGLFFINFGGPPNATHLWAVGQGGAGDVTDTHVVWKMTEDVPLESSPVLVGDLLYTLSDRGVLICKEAKTGKTVWSERLDGKYGASLLYANGRIYISSKEGKTTVIEPGEKFRKLAVNELDGFLGASPAVVGKSLLLRTKTHLYRVQDK